LDRVSTLKKVEQEFAKRDRLSFTYRIKRRNQVRYYQCQLIHPSMERREFIIAFKDVDDEVQEDIRNAKALNEQMGVIQALADTYDSVFLVDETGVLVPYRLKDVKQSEFDEIIREGSVWDLLMEDYAEKYVHSDYKEGIRI
jgi:hypothetical protein